MRMYTQNKENSSYAHDDELNKFLYSEMYSIGKMFHAQIVFGL